MSTRPITATLTHEEIMKRTTQAKDMETRYFNHGRIALGYYDIRIYFGQVSPAPSGEPAFTEELCVVVSPEYAHIFVELFSNLMSQYEQNFGKIRPLPPAMAGHPPEEK
jgi:Protein of unknown function (DUF3467)